MKTGPESRFYTLKNSNNGQPAGKLDIPRDLIIGIGPVTIPEYQNRPQIVTQNIDKTVTIAEFDRWGETLDLALSRLISENLRVLFPDTVIETYPWDTAIPVKYRVTIDFIRIVSELDKDVSFVAQWSVIEVKSNKMILIKKFEISEPVKPNDYSGLVKALSLGCASLSSQIAGGLITAANKAEAEENISGAAQKSKDAGVKP